MQFHARLGLRASGLECLPGIGDTQLALLEQMLHALQFVYALLIVAPRAALAFVRADIVELFFPVAQGGLGYTEQCRHFAYAVELLHTARGLVHGNAGVAELHEHVVVLFGAEVFKEIMYRIVGLAVHAHLVMQVRSGGFARVSAERNHIAAFHFLAFAHLGRVQFKVGVARFVAVAVVYLNQEIGRASCRERV